MQFSADRSRHRSPFFISLDFETRICKAPSVARRVETALPPGAPRKFNWITFESENQHALQCSKCVATKPCSEIQQSTEIMSHLSIFSFCYKIVSASGKHDYPLRVNQSPNCAEEFLRSLKEDMTSLYKQLRVNNPITISNEQLRQFHLQERCGICSTKFSDLPKSFKHRDHDHLEVRDLRQWQRFTFGNETKDLFLPFFSLFSFQGSFNKALCQECNLQYFRLVWEAN